jgi:hypothetical protein
MPSGSQERIRLLQDALDILILRALLLGPTEES